MTKWKIVPTEPTANMIQRAQSLERKYDIYIKMLEATPNPPDLLGALERLVKINEDHNAAIEKIIGKPPGWNDSYLDEARLAIAQFKGESDG